MDTTDDPSDKSRSWLPVAIIVGTTIIVVGMFLFPLVLARSKSAPKSNPSPAVSGRLNQNPGD